MKTGRAYVDYEPIVILWPVDSDVATDELAIRSGLTGTFHEIMESDVPTSRDGRNFWSVVNGKVKVDSAKKAKKDAEKQVKKDAKDAARAKLGLTEKELEDLLK